MSAIAASGIVRSPLLAAVPGLVHGFTTRELGSMAGSVTPKDEQRRNRAALEAHLGMPLVKASQVHSADVILVGHGRATRLRDGAAEDASSAMALEGDALITRSRGQVLAVAVADCVPVLVVTPDGWLGAAHAGWEGVTQRVVSAMLGELWKRDADVLRARVVIGPSIGPCCYEIDASRADVVRERLGRRAERVLYPRGERFLLDLWLAVRTELDDAPGGPRRAAQSRIVDGMDVCTKDEVARYFSHRGEEGKAGRGFAFVGWRTE